MTIKRINELTNQILEQEVYNIHRIDELAKHVKKLVELLKNAEEMIKEHEQCYAVPNRMSDWLFDFDKFQKRRIEEGYMELDPPKADA